MFWLVDYDGVNVPSVLASFFSASSLYKYVSDYLYGLHSYLVFVSDHAKIYTLNQFIESYMED